MTTERLFIAADHHAAFGCAGWAFVLAGAERTGAAGGARRSGPWRNAIAGLAAGLEAGKGPVMVVTANPQLAKLVSALRASTAPEGLEPADLPAWEALIKTAAGRPLGLQPVKPEPRTPQAFAAAWAETARDKARDKGDFRSPIPKPNLAKVPGL